jgi:DNA-binding NarL/FixJ family response regulator
MTTLADTMTETPHAQRKTNARGQLRIAILDDHLLFAESLDLVLTVEGYDVRRTEIPESAGSAGGLIASVLRMQPRIILLDLDLGTFGDGGRLIGPLAKACVNVVVVTASTDKARWGDALRQGARTVLPKSRPLNEILAVVRRLLQGLPVITHQELEDMLAHATEQRSAHESIRGRLGQLTPRETQVLGELMLGRTVHEISVASVVSEATVRTQVKSILAKLEVSSQLAAVGLAHQVGWHAPHI